MVPSLGTWEEKQRMPNESSEINHLNNHITTPERTRPTEIEYRTIPPQIQKLQNLTTNSWSLTKKAKTLSGVKQIHQQN